MVNRSLYSCSLLNGSSYGPAHLSGSPTSNSSQGDACCPKPAVGLLFWMTLDIMTMTMGVPSNLRVLWVLLRQQADVSTSDVFVGSLAALDCSYCMLLPAHLLNRMLIGHAAFSCALRFSLGLNEVGGPLFLCCLCLDRYTAVLQPIVYLRLRSASRSRAAAASLLWLFVLVYSALVAASVLWHSYRISVGLFVAAFMVTTFCNVSILRALQRAGPAGGDRHPVKQRALRTVRGVLVLLLTCFLPAAAIFPYSSALPKMLFRCYIYPMCYSFISLRAALQPLLYLLQTKKLQCQGESTQGCNSRKLQCQGGSTQGCNCKNLQCQGESVQGCNSKKLECQGESAQGYNSKNLQCQGESAQWYNSKQLQCQGESVQGCNGKKLQCQGESAQGCNSKKLQCQGESAQGCNSKKLQCQGESAQGCNSKKLQCQGESVQGCNSKNLQCQGESVQGCNSKNLQCQGDSTQGCNSDTPLT
ncbi:G-protein coupled receptor 4-like isoform X2 [Brienomyrus brachyistius]|nr:G-protein coupled receptor 4-like isoform X2 [Brienomyrus brachyistius]